MKTTNRHTHFKILALGTILLFSASPNGFANSSMDFFNEERIITAAKHAQKLTETPANVYVVTADDIQRYGYRTIDEALRSIPGCYFTDDRNYTYVWARGFGRPGDYNNRVLFLLNGHRLNDTLYDGAPTGHAFGIDMGIISRIEVMAGPSSALYGNNAFFGVVNIITHNPENAPRFRTNLEGGSFETKRGSVEASAMSKKGLGIYASANVREMEGQELYFPEYQSTNGGISPQEADREKNYNILGSISYKGWDISAMSARRLKGIPTGSYGSVFGDTTNHTVDASKYVELKTEQDITHSIHGTARFYHNWASYYGKYVYDYPPVTTNEDIGDNRWVGNEMVVRFTLPGHGNILMLGQEFEKNLETRQRNNDVEPYFLYLSDNRKESRYAFFAQQEYSPYSDFNLTLGLRYDHYSTFDPIFNPRIAAIHQLWEGSLMKLMYGTAFRGPTAYEQYYSDSTASKANPNLDPEKMKAYELLWEQRLANQGAVSLSLFHRQITNLISQMTDPADNLAQYINRDHVHSNGLEVASRYPLPFETKSRLSYIWQHTKEDNGETLANSPRHVVNIGLSHDISALKSTVSLETIVVSKRMTVKGTSLPTDTIMNLNFYTTPWSQGPRFYGGIYNLTNRTVFQSGGEEHIQPAIEQDGRNYIVGVEYKVW